MPREKVDLQNDGLQRQRALSRWDNEGGAGVGGPQVDPALRSDRSPEAAAITANDMPASLDGLGSLQSVSPEIRHDRCANGRGAQEKTAGPRDRNT